LDIYRRIGERIRHARLGARLTQPQLAQLLNVSKGIISRWETGLARPSLDRLEPLARRLGISVEQMLGFAVAEESGAYRARAVPVWELGADTLPDFKSASSVGEVLVSEEEALGVQSALLIKDDSFCPHFFAGDIVGVQTAGRPRLGDLIFVRRNNKVILRHYAGRRKGEILFPIGPSNKTEILASINLVGIFRWLHRPGRIVSRG